MNKQYFEQTVNAPFTVEPVDQVLNTPMIDEPDVIVDEAPVDEEHIAPAPVSGTFSAVAPSGQTVVYEAPAGEMVRHEEFHDTTNSVGPAALLDPIDAEHLRTRWSEIQGKFVDEPRLSVQQADELVTEVIGQITRMFNSETESLEGQWKEGNDVSTEDLRKVLQHYRSFFNRLVV